MALTKVTYSMIDGAPNSVIDYGADPTGTDDSAAAIQLALDAVRDNGNALVFPTGTYKVNSAITLLRNTTRGFEEYVIDGQGSTLDFSASGLTSGNLFSVGATSQANSNDTGFIKVSNLKIIGPETGAPYSGATPAGTTVGLSLEYALNVTLDTIYIQSCYKGINTNFVFPLRANAIELKSNYIGLYLDNDTTLGVWEGLSVTSARYGIVARPSTNTKIVSGQTFVTPRVEQCQVGVVLDPLDGSGYGIRGVVIERPYYESITYDYHRYGIAWTFANPATINADVTREVIWSDIVGGTYDGTNWTSSPSHRPLVLSTSGSVRSCYFKIPAAISSIVGDVTNSKYESLIDAYVGATSKIQTLYNGTNIQNNQPSFAAYVGTNITNVTGDSTAYTVVFNTQDFEYGGNDYSTATGIYTSTVGGRFQVSSLLRLTGITSSHTDATISIVSTGKTVSTTFNPYLMSTSAECSIGINWLMNIGATETFKIVLTVSGGTKVVGVEATESRFCGYFLG